jgi:cytochrome P450
MTNSPPIDLLSAASFAHGQPHGQFRWLRRNTPVYWHSERHGRGFWAVTRYHDVRAVGRDPKLFSSHMGGVQIADVDEPELAGLRNMMLFMDPPQHTRYRHLVSRQFTPHSVQALRARIERLAAQIIDRIAPRGECDLVRDIAGELPSYVIADLMGIPLEDGRRLYDLTEKMHASAEAVSGHEREIASMEMLQYAMGVAEEKGRNPGPDLATQLLNSEIAGDRLTPAEYGLFFMLLINAGGDTTRNLLAAGMLALFENPDQHDKHEQRGADQQPPGCWRCSKIRISGGACRTILTRCCPARWKRCCATSARSSICGAPRLATRNWVE